MSKYIDELIENINSVPSEFEINKKDEIRVIIGNDIYTEDSGIENIDCPDVPIYKDFEFDKVAFLTISKNLNLVSIVGIVLGSLDCAVELIDRIIVKQDSTMEKFALFLASKRIILVNSEGNEDKLLKLFETYEKHKVLFIGQKKDEDYMRKITKFLWLYHCSGVTYSKYYSECYSAYFDHEYAGMPGKSNSSEVRICDFQIS